VTPTKTTLQPQKQQNVVVRQRTPNPNEVKADDRADDIRTRNQPKIKMTDQQVRKLDYLFLSPIFVAIKTRRLKEFLH
jgi:protein subunit release factor A